ncbi:hypothetical protein ACP4OV_009948 [Aristida adscensionis]
MVSSCSSRRLPRLSPPLLASRLQPPTVPHRRPQLPPSHRRRTVSISSRKPQGVDQAEHSSSSSSSSSSFFFFVDAAGDRCAVEPRIAGSAAVNAQVIELARARRTVRCPSSSSSPTRRHPLLPLQHRSPPSRILERRRNRMDTLEPMNMTYELLKEITNGFSHDRILGRGTFGVVYKGVHKDGQEIAVKLLDYSISGVDDKEFLKEFNNLTKLKHQNIVKMVGFCNEAEDVPTNYEGKIILAQRMHRALCFEYMCNGSLQKHLYDEHQGLGWRERYKIIKGICEGLKHLHMGLEGPVYHLDLKPENILLDNNMVPKIADFGLSRLLGEDSTKKTISPVGSLGYCPPEFINYQFISTKFDIFSLGVIIIKIMCGTEGYFLFHDMRPDEFINHVHNKWTKRLQAIIGFTSPQGDCQEVKKCVEIVRYTSLERERDCQQVKKCLEIALKCIDRERETRPNIGYIVDQLEETEKDTIQMEEGLICCAQESVLRLVLYLHQFNASGPDRNEEVVVHSNYVHRFGLIIADDWILTPSSDPNDIIVARAQGLHMQAGQKEDNQWYKSFNLVFEDQRFAGSTLQVMGRTAQRNGEWSIVGGTGQFRRAKGTIEFTDIAESTPYDFIKKLDIEVFYTPRTS